MAANGRNPVAQGGMWNTPKANYSKATQDLLKGTIILFSIYCENIKAIRDITHCILCFPMFVYMSFINLFHCRNDERIKIN